MSTSRSQRLWLNSNYFIELDADGYCLSDCIEGAMGYIIRCRSGQPGGADVAWKLPRLTSDTQRENAYIAQLLEGERSNVCRVGNRANQLIRYHAVDNPLEYSAIGVRPAEVDPSTCAADQRILVRFSKGKRPRFCGVSRQADGALQVTPEGALCVAREEWDRLTRFLCGDAHGVGRFASVFLADQRDGSTANRPAAYSSFVPGLLSQVVESETARRGWYTGLPTIVYDWANGTLQDAISNHRRRGWSTTQHLVLIERLLSGLGTLHRAGMLHGDIRPANIMYTGDANDPEAYIIIDAGSLASGNANIVGGGPVEQSVDKTILSAIANARSSTFYAPERRQAFEHEDGDLAVVVADPRNKQSLIVAIGWRSRIEEAREPGSEQAPFTTQLEPFIERWIGALDEPRPAGDERGGARLCAGDRVRLREYVFDVVEPPLVVDGFSVMLCKASVTKVWNDRLVVPLGEFWREFSLPVASAERFVAMALPKVVEIYQWSQATDLFSIGVLLLYSVHGQGQGETTSMEREFTALLDTLANPLYFSRMWPHIDRVCMALERIIDEKPGISAQEFCRSSSGIHESPSPSELNEYSSSSAGSRTIYHAAIDIVQHITQTAPHARKLVVEGFAGNVAEFLLFIHFVFSCLHRRADLIRYDVGDDDGEPLTGQYPFSQDRTSRDPRATDQALRRIRRLRELYVRGIFRDMCSPPDLLPDYRPVSQAELILSLNHIRQELDEARRRLVEEREAGVLLSEQQQRAGVRIGPLWIAWGADEAGEAGA